MNFFKKKEIKVEPKQVLPVSTLRNEKDMIDLPGEDSPTYVIDEALKEIIAHQKHILSLLEANLENKPEDISQPHLPENKVFDSVLPDAPAPPEYKKWECKICHEKFTTKKKLGMHYVDDHSD
jgi:hypothetical protein